MQKVATLVLSLTLSGTVSANRFVNAAGLVAGAGGYAIGVSHYAGIASDVIAVDANGTSIVEAGGVVAVGDALESDANGKAVEFDAGVKLARALQSASGAGQRIEVLLIPN